MFTALPVPEAPITTADSSATLIPAASETMPVALSSIPTTISPDQFSLAGPMERISMFPSIWPAAPVIGRAIQNTVAVSSVPDAGHAIPIASSSQPQSLAGPGNSKQHGSESTLGNVHVHSEAGSSPSNFSVRYWYPGLRYGVAGGKKRRKPDH